MRLRHLDERARLLAEAATTESSSSCFEMSGMEKELQALENNYGGSDVEEEAESNYCVVCNKQLRNEKAYGNHLKQKKHRENVAALKKLLEEDSSVVAHDIDVDQLHLALGEIDSPTNDIDQTEEGEVEFCNLSRTPKIGSKKTKKQRKLQHQRQRQNNIAAQEHSEEDKNLFSPYGSNIEDRNQSLCEETENSSRRKKSNRRIETEVRKSADSSLDRTLTNDGAGAVVSRTKKKKNRRKNRGNIEDDNSSDEANRDCNKCAVCATTFESKNKLFNHLKTTGHAICTRK